MVEQAKEILQSSGLDTLSERALRRLTDSWTGSLHSVDTLLDASSQTQVASSSSSGVCRERFITRRRWSL